MLFPQQNEHRTVFDLNGFWRFLPDLHDAGETERWFSAPLPDHAMLIAVPGAWNEQLAERGLMNYVGKAWYETTFSLPQSEPRERRTFLRIGAANHAARVWLNGICIGGHEGGYLPFELDMTEGVIPGALNRLTVSVDSALSMETLPQDIDPDAPPYNDPSYDRRHVYPPTRFDFFPYGGLTRPVQIIVVSMTYIRALAIHATLDGKVEIEADWSGDEGTSGTAEILDARGQSIHKADPVQAGRGRMTWSLQIPSPRRWSPADPCLYEAVVTLIDARGKACDSYTEPFGFRELRVKDGTILLNGSPLYLTGFGKHEDVPILGHGHFRPACLRDFELMRWVGANSFRTSHYPYDEEVLRLADRMGFLVIDESPAVSLGFLSDRFSDLAPLLAAHKKSLEELIHRDRNHPSVIAWSAANEPNLWSEPHAQSDAARRYFREVYAHVQSLDQDRPVIAIVTPTFSADDVSLDACDVIGINRYFAWYTHPAELERARRKLSKEMDDIFARHGKPIIITECGVDTVEGYHATVPQMFTEEYQTEFLKMYCEVAESKPFCAGLHVWNFADFLTPQNFRRVVLNRKGVFTRSREPKSAAFFLHSYWCALLRVDKDHRPKRFSDSRLIPDVRPART